jgi:imidazoleglycerol-phosphate dehydratase
MEHKIRVMIVDDSADSRENTAKLLGFEPEIEIVDTAGSGTECIDKAPLAAPDVLLMDVNMPDMDGITATQVLTAEMPNVAVIILSVEDDPEIVRRALVAGARGYLVKPATHDQMMEAIRQVYRLQQHQPQNQDAWAAADGPPRRRTRFARVTNETQITVTFDLDGSGQGTIQTGVPFLDHLLQSFARHGRFDLDITANGDLAIDDHHTVEDVGIVLGQALRQAAGDRAGIARYGHAYAPMDEALARAVVDLSGRPFTVYTAPGLEPTLGGVRVFHTGLAEEFWRALATHAALTLHIDLIRGHNAHHCLEASAKAVAVGLRAATPRIDPGGAVASTKGVLE